jgi:hypothetical protein
MDERRLWWLSIALILAALAVVLDISRQFNPLTTILSAGVPSILGLVVLARGACGSRILVGAIGAAPLLLVAVVELLVPPGKHPEIIALLFVAALVALAVGFPIGLYSQSRTRH